MGSNDLSEGPALPLSVWNWIALVVALVLVALLAFVGITNDHKYADEDKPMQIGASIPDPPAMGDAGS